jgi:hypothetical protein
MRSHLRVTAAGAKRLSSLILYLKNYQDAQELD